MPPMFQDHWPLFLIGAVVIALVAWLLLRPRQRVTLSSDVPIRPHMTATAATGEKRGILGEAASAAGDVAGAILSTNVHDQLPGAGGPPDPLQQLKGVGPRMATMLGERGLTRFDQIAKLSPSQVETLDETLGAFRGRFARDRIVEQADYLSRGDVDGYEAKFGKL